MISRRDLALLRAMHLHGTVTAAAASVHMSQPAASAVLQGLESRVGFALFTRDKRRLRLTSQGRTLMPEVLQAMTALDAVDRLAGDIRQGATERLNVGAVAVASAMLLPQALKTVRMAHPHLAVTVRAGTALEIMDMVADQRVDLGVVIAPTRQPNDRIVVQRLARLSLHAVLRPEHPAARRRRPPSLVELAEVGLIVLSPSLPAGLATQHVLQAEGLLDRPVLEVSQSFTACEFAAQGLGVAIVETVGACYAQQRGLVARDLKKMEGIELSVVSPRDRPPAGASHTLRHALGVAAEALTAGLT